VYTGKSFFRRMAEAFWPTALVVAIIAVTAMFISVRWGVALSPHKAATPPPTAAVTAVDDGLELAPWRELGFFLANRLAQQDRLFARDDILATSEAAPFVGLTRTPDVGRFTLNLEDPADETQYEAEIDFHEDGTVEDIRTFLHVDTLPEKFGQHDPVDTHAASEWKRSSRNAWRRLSRGLMERLLTQDRLFARDDILVVPGALPFVGLFAASPDADRTQIEIRGSRGQRHRFVLSYHHDGTLADIRYLPP